MGSVEKRKRCDGEDAYAFLSSLASHCWER